MRVALLFLLSSLICATTGEAQGNPNDFGRAGPTTERQMYFAQVRKQVNDLWIRWQDARERNDAAELARLYAEEGSYLPPASSPVPTRSSIRDYFANVLGTVGEVQVRMMDFGTSGDLAYATGRVTYQLQTRPGENKQLVRTDLLVLRRRPKGEWQIQTHLSREDPE